MEHLENRIVPSNITVNAGDTTGLIAAINQANTDSKSAIADTITLTNSTYSFAASNNTTNGANVLPVITASGLTIQGSGSTLNAASNGRLFDVASGASVTLVNMKLTGGLASGATAEGGAVYNTGALTMKTVIVGANQATAGSGENAAGGGIYSSGGSLTLVNDVIGRTIHKSKSTTYTSTSTVPKTAHATKTIGTTNKVAGGSGGSGLGGGLYVGGGALKLTNCTIGGNQVTGSVNAQGGGLYVAGVAKLNLTNDLVGRKSVQTSTITTTKTVLATSTTGSANTLTGGTAQGGGLYVSGGTVIVSNGVIAGNKALGGASQNAAGGGVYATNASLTFTDVAFLSNRVFGGAGAAVVGSNGGNAQGGGLFVSGGNVKLSNCQVTALGSYSVHGGKGGIGGNGGNAQGGGIYAINTSLTITGVSHIDRNAIAGGTGGNGTLHHLAGGTGGNAQGGGVFATASTVVITDGSTLYNDFAGAGAGGKGGSGINAPQKATASRPGATAGGQGGNGGQGQGGGLFANGGSVTIAGGTTAATTINISFDDAEAGNGGAGGNGGVGVNHGQTGGVGGTGGAGGEGAGGGMYVNGAPLTVTGDVTINTNNVNGGAGGQGGVGGAGYRAQLGTKGTVKTWWGGNGGPGGAGGVGGAAQGGGLFATGNGLTISLGNSAGSVAMDNNQIYGGHGGGGGAGDIYVSGSQHYVGITYIDGPGGQSGNGGNASGGGAAISGDKLTILNTDIQQSIVQGGGGGYNRGVYSNTPYGSIRYGGAGSAAGGAGGSAQGGGLFVSGSSAVTILNSTLANNSANYLDNNPARNVTNAGNGGYGGNGGKNTSHHNYVGFGLHGGKGGNAGTNQGAGLYAASSTLTVLNSTIADNVIYDALGGAGGTGTLGNGAAGSNGSSQGSGIYATNGSLSLINDTIAWNFLKPSASTGSPSDEGAGIFTDASNALTLQNTIVALNQIYNSYPTTPTTTNSDLYGAAATSSDHNLIGDGTGSSGLTNGTSGNQVGTDAAPINPQFSVAAPAGAGQGQLPGIYGGPTPTLPLDWNSSPAFRTGNPSAVTAIANAEGVSTSSAVDETGLPRVLGGYIDIGAVETQVLLSGTPSVTTVSDGGTITYTVTVTNFNPAAAKVTLTDVLDTNTTYQSSSGTGWTITAPNSSSSGGTLTATASIATGATATLTITVNVSSTAPGGTTLANTAGVTLTGTSYAIANNVTMNTLVQSTTSTTLTVLNSSPNPSVYGQNVTLTASVTANNSVAGTPTGTVTFKDGSTVLGTGTVNSNGVAALIVSSLAVGGHNLTAVYGGDTNDLTSTSTAVTQTVNKDNTTTTVTSSTNPSAFGQSVTYTATVSVNSPGAGIPTGTVTFYDGSTSLGTGSLSGTSTDTATFTISTLAVGSHSITATYGGDTNDAGSTSASAVSQTVSQDSTTTTVTSSASSSVYGQSVTYTATVSVNSPGAGTPTGTVTFYDGSTMLGAGTLSGTSTDTATFSTSSLAIGSHSITAVYGGDTNDTGSTSATAVSQTVSQDSTTTTLTSSASSAVYGQSVTFTARVGANSPGAGTPTGTVTFYDGSTSLGTGALSNGVATLTISSLSLGSHSITAVYGGDTNFKGSTTASAVSQSVSQDKTTTTLTSSANPSAFGQSVTFTATVSVNNPGVGTPTGTVDFYDGSTLLGSGTLSGDPTATFTISTLAVGSHSITAVYLGDTDDVGGTSSAVSQTVNQDSTTVTLTSSANPSTLAQSITFRATVSVVSPGVGTPTGTVTFYDGSTSLGTGTLSNGVATFSTSTLSIGSNSITAVYSGDTNDAGSTSAALVQHVDYKFSFLPPLSWFQHYEVNRTIPITFTLKDANGNYISSLSAVTSIQIQALDSNGNPVGAPFTPVSTNGQGLENVCNVYLYLWKTKGLAAGSYEIEVKLADGTTQTITIQLVQGGCSAGLTSGSGGTATAGALVGGEVDLYVDNTNGDLTSDELARIQDAINSIDATINTFGVNIVQVTDPTQADVTLNMDTTSSLGGVAQGILGCTSNADQVTMIQGWSWYAGSDPTQIGSGQYDFETAVMHELGHVLGLGHSSASTSVMYASLSTGTTTRMMTAADLNVPDSDSGPCALQAAPLPTASVFNTVPNTPTPSSSTVSLGGLTPPAPSGSPLSPTDQLFTNFTLLLNDLRSAYQAQMSSAAAMWQQAEAQLMQRLDFLLSMETGAMGASTDTPTLDFLLGNTSSSKGV